jgi:3-oxoacyl-[acyl-carrier-protein] synthase-3
LTQLLTHRDGERGNIRYVLYAHTIQTVAPFPMNVLHEVLQEVGLENANAFSLTMQNCASSIGALEICTRLLENTPNPEDKAIILTGEKAFSPTVQLIPSTTIMGEASAACLVAKNGDRDRVLAVKQKTLGKFSRGVSLDPETLREFEAGYVPTLAETIREALRLAGLQLADIALILPHNINMSSWRRVSRDLEFPIEKIYVENIPRLGHCFCNDIFLNHQSARTEGRLKVGDNYLMIGVGLGATFGVAVLQH